VSKGKDGKSEKIVTGSMEEDLNFGMEGKFLNPNQTFFLE
jgi:hypothetical protein